MLSYFVTLILCYTSWYLFSIFFRKSFEFLKLASFEQKLWENYFKAFIFVLWIAPVASGWLAEAAATCSCVSGLAVTEAEEAESSDNSEIHVTI